MSAREDTAGVRMWLDIDTTSPMMVKNVLSKIHREIDKKASKEHEEAKKNSNFTQTYPKGWQRIRELVRDKQVLPL